MNRLLVATTVCGALFTSCGGVKSERPNILFILSDDHSRQAISAYGGILAEYAPTPNIDAIAESGVRLDNMLCTNSISGPSRACLVTGKYSTTNGFYQNEGGIIFDNTQPTSATILQENGYNTALFGKWHLYSEPKGFDHYKIHDNPSQQGDYWNPLYNTNGVKEREEGYCTTITANSALEWLESGRDEDKPFCMMLHFKAPHGPWDPDSTYLNLFDGVEMPYPATFDDDYSTREMTAGKSMAQIKYNISRRHLKQTPPEGLTHKERAAWLAYGSSGDKQLWSPSDTLKGEELRRWKYQMYIKDYLRTIRSVDDQVGRVTQYLKDNGLYDNTVIVYMGDQGFYLGDHGWFDKRWIYEESIQMACLLSYPNGVKSGATLDNITANIDIAPTLLDFAGIETPEDMQGESFKPLLEGDKAADESWRKSFYYQYFEYPKWHNIQPHYGIRSERYTLAHFYYNIDTWELYDRENDPHQLRNEYNNPAYKEVIEELKAELKELQKHYNDDISLTERRELTDRYSITYEN